ncbi:MAG: DUF4258 domain-containing protein [Proteobacteria bacterium]|jgi:hypothetical protein|nr:DUF4258 domain-containing protein [Pseudomonadota bacterium]
MRQRGATAESVVEAIRSGQREPARRGCSQFRLSVPFGKEWGGRAYAMQQIVPIVAEEDDCLVVVTVFTFYFQEGGDR